MKFPGKVKRNMTIKIPATVVQHMGLQPDDIIEITIEHALPALIAKSDKFNDFIKQLGSIKLNDLYVKYQDTGGKAKYGGFKVWLVKELKLYEKGLNYWTGKARIEDVYPDGKIPVIVPVGSDIDNEKKGE